MGNSIISTSHKVINVNFEYFVIPQVFHEVCEQFHFRQILKTIEVQSQFQSSLFLNLILGRVKMRGQVFSNKRLIQFPLAVVMFVALLIQRD